MNFIQTVNKALDLFGLGKHGFSAGSPASGVLATKLSADWCNGVQQELINVIEAGGLTPNSESLNQVATAIQSGKLFSAQAAGTADAITATYSPGITALKDGMVLYVRGASANATTTPTFTPASGTIEPKTIVKGAGSALAAGDIVGAGHWLELVYDLALDKWLLSNPLGPGITDAAVGGVMPLTLDGVDGGDTIQRKTIKLAATQLDFVVPIARGSFAPTDYLEYGSVARVYVPALEIDIDLIHAEGGAYPEGQLRMLVLSVLNEGVVRLALLNAKYFEQHPYLDHAVYRVDSVASLPDGHDWDHTLPVWAGPTTSSSASLPCRIVGYFEVAYPNPPTIYWGLAQIWRRGTIEFDAKMAALAASSEAGSGVIPAGKVDFFATITAPSGYLKANGAAVSRTTYSALFAAIGTMFGDGDGSTTFDLPDLRGEFVRGWDDGRAVDIGRVVGTQQLDAMQGHIHGLLTNGGQGSSNSAQNLPSSTGALNSCKTGGPESDGTNGSPRIAAETRPRNVALLACIKY
jgi:microcystin-dependent protein